MSYGLLWVEGLAIALLWVATWAAVAARLRRRGRAAILLFVTVGAMLLLFGFFVLLSAVLKSHGLEENWLAYTLSLFIACGVGATVILIRARRRPEPGMARAAAAWPRGGLALALAAFIALDAMTLWNMDLAVRGEAATVRTEAGAMLLSVAPPQVEDERNAAILYEKAFARLKADKSLVAEDSPLEADAPDLTGPAVTQLLGRHATTLRLLREAASMPGCRFDHDYARPSISMLLPELNWERTAANLLKLDARHAAATKDPRRVVEDVNALFRLSRAAGSAPVAITGLVQMGLDRMGVHVLEDVLPSLGARELSELRIGDPASIGRLARRSLQGEEAFGLSIFSDLAGGGLTLQQLTAPSPETKGGSGGGVPDAGDLPPFPLLMRVFVMPSDMRAYQQYMESCQARAEQPFANTTERDREATSTAAHHGLLTSIIVPALDRFLFQAAHAQASHAAAYVGVAADRYRLDHGTFPPSLDALVPQYLDDVPLDPFDNAPLKFRLRGGDFLVYSIGPDRKDDGGAPFDQQAKTGDLVFAVRSTPTTAPASEPTKG
jgi:type II secretory pathway pseudopilin PulG